jgi:AbiJ-like protein
VRKFRPFSAREGLLGLEGVPQPGTITQRLRNRLASQILTSRFKTRIGFGDLVNTFGHQLLDEFFGLHVERRPHISKVFSHIESTLLRGEWNLVYDLLEYIATTDPLSIARDRFNVIFEEEESAYRFIGPRIVPVTSQMDIENAELALQHPVQAAREHIAKSLAQLAVRPTPNYGKVVAEAIQSVEAVARHLTGNDSVTLGDALKTLKRTGQHSQTLLTAYEKIYGWSSNEGGVRHSFKGEEVDLGLARYMLFSCSAFIGYLVELKSKPAAES